MASPTGEEIKEFIETVVHAIVDHPERVEVSILESGSMTVVELTAARSDIGKVIGREGRMAQSLRILLTALATKLGRKAVLQILEK
jgi:predicted RNA-binding protein YlqC (UPF0109 family)